MNELLSTTDAQVWAQEWVRIAREIEAADDGRQVIDEGWMIGWFANAIETGRSAGGRLVLDAREPDYQAAGAVVAAANIGPDLAFGVVLPIVQAAVAAALGVDPGSKVRVVVIEEEG